MVSHCATFSPLSPLRYAKKWKMLKRSTKKVSACLSRKTQSRRMKRRIFDVVRTQSGKKSCRIADDCPGEFLSGKEFFDVRGFSAIQNTNSDVRFLRDFRRDGIKRRIHPRVPCVANERAEITP